MKMSRILVSLGLAAGTSFVPLEDVAAEANHAEAARGWRATSRDDETTRVFKLLGKNATWELKQTLSVSFPTFHTQGLVKIGETFFVSSVEVAEPRVSNGVTDALYDFSIDRSAGVGRAWLFAFDAGGTLLGKVELTEGDVYHPGGMDFDGQSLWVPVAEYRPNSRSNIYRVDPETLKAELVFSADDHIGGIVKNRHRGTLHGVSWGSRRLYTWSLRGGGTRGAPSASRGRWEPNPEAYIDYQDCHYQGIEYMLCGGVGGYSTPLGSIAFGGLDLLDLRRNRLEHQVPVNVFIDEGDGQNPGLSLAHNAFWAEPTGDGSLRVYFMTESDNQAELLTYEATPWVNR
jgi:hypothetical protein